MRFIADKGYHQWLYTNGIYATEDVMKKLKDAGLNEIRFNLAATNCSDKVIEKLKIARKYVDYLCIESPMFTKFYNTFIKKKQKILDTGVDHIHFAELQLFPNTFKIFVDEGPIYRHRSAYISPIKSRQLTYDIFELAANEGWKNVVLFDCSNDCKFLRGVKIRTNHFADIGYNFENELPDEFYEEALARYPIKTFQKYIEALQNEMRLESGDVDNYINLAKIYRGTGEHKKSIEVLQCGMQKCSSKKDFHLELAEWRQKDGDHEKSIQELIKCEQEIQLESKEFANYVVKIAYSYIELRIFKKAIKIAKSCLDHIKEDYEEKELINSLREILAFSYLETGRFDMAKALYCELRKENPQELIWLYNLGIIYGRLGKIQQAQNVFEKIISKNPKFFLDVVDFLKKYPKSIHNYFGLAMIYYIVGKIDEVKSIYKKLNDTDLIWANKLKRCINIKAKL